MRFKDIEKKLKREQDGRDIPDVYARVSNAPLNKLLSGETPVRAFQKQLVMRLLIFALVLLLMIAIGLSAIWLLPNDENLVPDCYASISISGDSGEQRIGLVMSGRNIISLVVEVSDGQINEQPLISHSSRIKDFIVPKAGDKVLIELLSNRQTTLTEVNRFIKGEIEAAYDRTAFEMRTVSNSSATRNRVKQYIEACDGTVETDTIPALIQTYAEFFK